MRLIECATSKHSFTWKGEPAELVFNGKALELDDDLAQHLLEESPANFRDVTPDQAPVEPVALDAEKD